VNCSGVSWKDRTIKKWNWEKWSNGELENRKKIFATSPVRLPQATRALFTGTVANLIDKFAESLKAKCHSTKRGEKWVC